MAEEFETVCIYYKGWDDLSATLTERCATKYRGVKGQVTACPECGGVMRETQAAVTGVKV